MNKESLSIVSFHPILKHRIWGGKKLMQHFGKKSEQPDQIGESWEVSNVHGDVSVVASGKFEGRTLTELVETYQEDFLGPKAWKRFGTDFPILIKFIDADKDLSVQLHPDDTIARKKHNSFGKTEMWYVMGADKNAKLVTGFEDGITLKKYKEHVDSGTLESVLNYEPVTAGDTFFIAPGTVHAIGEGVVIAEIQQTSDVTYRIYDYNRTDAQGNTRELHQEEALDAINFSARPEECKVSYARSENKPVSLVSCPYFTTVLLELDQNTELSHTDMDSFVIYMCVGGSATVQDASTQIDIRTGQTVLVPAAVKEIKVNTNGVKLLQVHIES